MSQLEKVDIVDEQDNVLYQTTKQTAHKDGLLHRTVISEVKDSEGRWILVKQSSDRQDAGQYVSPVGGHIRAGETEIQVLQREALEGLGIKDFDYKFIGKAIYNRYILGRQENHYFILYEIFSDQTPQLNHESESYKSFTKEELKTRLKAYPQEFAAAFRFVVKTFYPELT